VAGRLASSYLILAILGNACSCALEHAPLLDHAPDPAVPLAVGELRATLGSARVVGATCLGVSHPIFSLRRFDICVVDEACQVTLPVRRLPSPPLPSTHELACPWYRRGTLSHSVVEGWESTSSHRNEPPLCCLPSCVLSGVPGPPALRVFLCAGGLTPSSCRRLSR